MSAGVDDYFEIFAALSAKTAQQAYDNYVGEYINIDLTTPLAANVTEDKLYAARLKMLATEVQLPYNDVVKRYINVYTRTGGTMCNVLGLGHYYFPIFEQALYKHGLPMELKMLPVIESALIPAAKSHASAVGLWQMMILTAKYYGLEVNSFVDERQDPVKSTEAACKYLKDLYKSYGDWTLVIAAYNCGPGNVNKAIKRAGNIRTYWDIWDYLPRETRNYVPAFIGASYGYTFYKAHNLSIKSPSHSIAVDTISINRMMHLEQVSSTIDISIEQLRALNPQYRIDIIPAMEKSYALILPQNLIGKFIENQSDIFAKDTMYLKKYLQIENFSPAKAEQIASNSSSSGRKVTYKVKSGDSLGRIAEKYKVKVSDIQKWNKIKGTNIRAGQNIVLYT